MLENFFSGIDSDSFDGLKRLGREMDALFSNSVWPEGIRPG